MEAAVLAARFELRTVPELCMIDGQIPPLVWPAWRKPIVVLPAGLIAKLDRDQRLTLLAHELAHIRRGDHRWRCLHLAALAVYWWHPVAWWSVRRIQEAEENCCDAWVVWAVENSHRSYAQTLLDTIDFLAPAQFSLPPQASGLGRFHLLKRRIEMLMQRRVMRQMSFRNRTAVFIIGAAILVVSAQIRPASSATDDSAADETTGPAPTSADANTASSRPVKLDGVEAKVKLQSYQGLPVYDSPPNAEAKPETTMSSSGKAKQESALNNRLEELEAKVHRLEQQLNGSQKRATKSAISPNAAPQETPGKRTLNVQLVITGPPGATILCSRPGQLSAASLRLKVPFEFVEGARSKGLTTELIISNVPGHEATELVTRVLVNAPTEKTIEFLANHPIPILITADEFATALGGSSVMKFVYLDHAAREIDPSAITTLSTSGGQAERQRILQDVQRGEGLAMLDIGSAVVTYVGGKEKMTNPPSRNELEKSLPDLTQDGTHFGLGTPSRANLRFVVEQIADNVEETRFYPLVGPAQLHKAHFKCTVNYKLVMRSDWPIPFVHEDDKTEVIYLDHDHLIRVPGPPASSASKKADESR